MQYTDETKCDFGKKYVGTLLKDIPTSYLRWFTEQIKKAKDRGAFTLQEKAIVDYTLTRATGLVSMKVFNKDTKLGDVNAHIKAALVNFTKLNYLEDYSMLKSKIKITIEEIQ